MRPLRRHLLVMASLKLETMHIPLTGNTLSKAESQRIVSISIPWVKKLLLKLDSSTIPRLQGSHSRGGNMSSGASFRY